MYILMKMTTKIAKWGNSYAIRLPKKTLDELSLKEGHSVIVSTYANSIRIKPVEKKYKLNDLLDKIRPENIHPPVDWGPDVGNEILPEWRN